jgi:hypothetical protein
MIWAEGLLPDGQRAQMERLGLDKLFLGVAQHPQIVQAGGYIWMTGAKGLLRSEQGFFRRYRGFGVVALLEQRCCFSIKRLSASHSVAAAACLPLIRRASVRAIISNGFTKVLPEIPCAAR